ncbi:hypothetical protein [Bradyrhizobium roseum]|uniref:hypothetical protein n=1 Tax=Bradyrhizobium roseum TaxID=3056648 RepID=UPI0026321A81|nr:hypothetical protein QUH67_16350 [Bradyrhizobium roseus]
MPEVKFEMSPRGVTMRSIRHQDDGKVSYRVTEAALPTLRVPNPRVAQFARVESIGWTLPIDDTLFRVYVAQVGQGPVTLHSEEHFGRSDRGVLMIRRNRDPAPLPTAGPRGGGKILCDLHHDALAKNRPETGRMKPFCRNRETILKHIGRSSLA